MNFKFMSMIHKFIFILFYFKHLCFSLNNYNIRCLTFVCNHSLILLGFMYFLSLDFLNYFQCSTLLQMCCSNCLLNLCSFFGNLFLPLTFIFLVFYLELDILRRKLLFHIILLVKFLVFSFLSLI